MTAITERLRDRAARMATKGNADALNDAADEIDRLTAENAALRDERDASRAKLRERTEQRDAQMTRAEDLAAERDALAAEVDYLKQFQSLVMETRHKAPDIDWAKRRDSVVSHQYGESSLILAARDARVKADALREAADWLTRNQLGEAGMHISGVADAIEKEAGNG